MKKPVFIRFFGWAFLFLFSLFVSYHFLKDQPGWGPNEALGALVALALSLPCLLIWIVGTLVYKISSAYAQQQAQTMAELLRQAQHSTTMCGFPGPDNLRCDLPAGHQGQHRAAKVGPRAVMTSPLGLTGTDRQ